MTWARSGGLAMALFGTLFAVQGCTTGAALDGNTAFGNTADAVNTTGNIDYFSSDEALAEGKAYFRAQSYGNATAAFRKAVELAPNDPEAWLGLAASYDRLRRFDLADRAYEQFSARAPMSYQYHNNRGYSYMLRGDLDRARRHFLKAYELAPNDVVVANNLKLLGSSSATVVR